MARSPTEQTLKYLRRSGYVCQVTEVWVAHQWAEKNANGSQPGFRRDLFGFIDVLALLEGQVLAVQCTAVSGMSSRYRKILGQEKPPSDADEKKIRKTKEANVKRRRAVEECLAAGWTIVIYGWDKGMKLPKIRYVDETDLVDQAKLPL